MMFKKELNHRKAKYVLILSICGILSILTVVFSEQIHYLDPQYIAFRKYLGQDDSCSFLKSVMQQDTYLQGTNDLKLLKWTYHDQNCGNPDVIPKEHSVIVDAKNIQTITRDDLDFEHIPKDHTVVIDCLVWNIKQNENLTRFNELMSQHGCEMTSVNSANVGNWRYFN